MRTTLFFTLLLCATQAVPGRAQYGWPPPNYTVTGVSLEDGSHYRNLRQVLRDQGCGWRLREIRANWTGVGLNVDGPPPARLYAPLGAPPTDDSDLLPAPRPVQKTAEMSPAETR